jgi:hypothetical protein
MTRSVPTVQSLRTSGRRLDRRLSSVSRVLTVLQNGGTLHLTHTRGGDVWILSNGTHVPFSTAAVVIAHPHVEAANDGLFSGTSQTYRAKEWRGK